MTHYARCFMFVRKHQGFYRLPSCRGDDTSPWSTSSVLCRRGAHDERRRKSCRVSKARRRTSKTGGDIQEPGEPPGDPHLGGRMGRDGGTRRAARQAQAHGLEAIPAYLSSTALAMALRASASARSFSGCPEWPRTQCQLTSWRAAAASSRCHSSTFFTGFLSAVLQPRRFHEDSHLVMPSFT